MPANVNITFLSTIYVVIKDENAHNILVGFMLIPFFSAQRGPLVQ